METPAVRAGGRDGWCPGAEGLRVGARGSDHGRRVRGGCCCARARPRGQAEDAGGPAGWSASPGRAHVTAPPSPQPPERSPPFGPHSRRAPHSPPPGRPSFPSQRHTAGARAAAAASAAGAMVRRARRPGGRGSGGRGAASTAPRAAPPGPGPEAAILT